MVAWTALISRPAWVGLERIFRRIRQFFSVALARSPGARSAEWARLTAFIPPDSGRWKDLRSPDRAGAPERCSDRGAEALVGGVRERGRPNLGHRRGDAVVTGGAGVMPD